jgi:hypothetical protein
MILLEPGMLAHTYNTSAKKKKTKNSAARSYNGVAISSRNILNS